MNYKIVAVATAALALSQFAVAQEGAVLRPVQPTAQQMNLLKRVAPAQPAAQEQAAPAPAPAPAAVVRPAPTATPVAATEAPAPAPAQRTADQEAAERYLAARAAAMAAQSPAKETPAAPNAAKSSKKSAASKAKELQFASTVKAEVAPAKIDPVVDVYKRWASTPKHRPLVENGVVKFFYDDPAPVMLCAPMRVCAIEFEPDEHIENFVVGGGQSWSHQRLEGSRPVYVLTPSSLDTIGTLSNVLVYSSKPNGERRSYNIILKAVDLQGDVISRYSFIHRSPLTNVGASTASIVPGGAKVAAATEQSQTANANSCSVMLPSIDKADLAYVVEGEAEFKPTMVFTDGQKTFFRIPDGAKSPALLVERADGKGEAVNVNPRCGYLVVDQKVLRARLVLAHQGKEEVVTVSHKSAKRSGFAALGFGN